MDMLSIIGNIVRLIPLPPVLVVIVLIDETVPPVVACGRGRFRLLVLSLEPVGVFDGRGDNEIDADSIVDDKCLFFPEKTTVWQQLTIPAVTEGRNTIKASDKKKPLTSKPALKTQDPTELKGAMEIERHSEALEPKP